MHLLKVLTIDKYGTKNTKLFSVIRKYSTYYYNFKKTKKKFQSFKQCTIYNLMVTIILVNLTKLFLFCRGCGVVVSTAARGATEICRKL